MKKSPTVSKGKVTVVSMGQVSARIYHVRNDGRSVYTIAWSAGAGRQRRTKSDEGEAIEEAKRIVTEVSKGRSAAASLPVDQIEYFRQQASRLGDTPLHEAVQFYLDNAPKLLDRTLGTVIEEFLAASERRAGQRGSTDRWCNTLRSRLGQLSFSLSPNTKFGGITTDTLEDFLHSNSEWSVCSRYNMAAVVKGLFRFAQRRGYLPVGLTAADRLEDISKPVRTPTIFTPVELAAVLEAAEEKFPELVPYIAIGAFAGVRAAEITRLCWGAHIDLDEGIIRLPSEITKTSRRRIVEISDTLKAWLVAYRKESGPVCPANPYKSLPALAVAAGVTWPHNVLRHSFVSYEVARTKDPVRVAHTSGHSVTTLQVHYKQLVTPRQAEQWFKIVPRAKKL